MFNEKVSTVVVGFFTFTFGVIRNVQPLRLTMFSMDKENARRAFPRDYEDLLNDPRVPFPTIEDFILHSKSILNQRQ